MIILNSSYLVMDLPQIPRDFTLIDFIGLLWKVI